ncbi:hypothetical protein Droror1_Dr00023181 [Drosera rotundifolia]
MSSVKLNKVPPLLDIYHDQTHTEKVRSSKGTTAFLPASRRELLDSPRLKTTSRDVLNPSNPGNIPSAELPPYSSSPTIIIIPATNPAGYTPNIPASTPLTVPSVSPFTVTPTTPSTSPVPVSYPTPPSMNPGTSPITNPVTTFPTPVGYVPPTSPSVTNAPSPVTSAPIIPGQTWCIVRSGVSDSALQTALDYACGIGGADCSLIQPGASCYDPDTVENHASYAFNMYFQTNPVASSCDFGGMAMLTNTNPSSRACIYPSLQMLPASPVTTVPPPTITTPPATTASASGATGSPSYQSPPLMPYTTNPASAASTIYGSDSPTALNSTVSGSTRLQPFVNYAVNMISMFALGNVYFL